MTPHSARRSKLTLLLQVHVLFFRLRANRIGCFFVCELIESATPTTSECTKPAQRQYIFNRHTYNEKKPICIVVVNSYLFL